jgi:hypothetical protein
LEDIEEEIEEIQTIQENDNDNEIDDNQVGCHVLLHFLRRRGVQLPFKSWSWTTILYFFLESDSSQGV